MVRFIILLLNRKYWWKCSKWIGCLWKSSKLFLSLCSNSLEKEWEKTNRI